MHVNIKKLNIGDLVEGRYMLSECDKRYKDNDLNQPYFVIVIADKTGSMEGRMWGAFGEPMETPIEVTVKGSVTDFRGKPQFKAGTITPVFNGNVDQYIKTAPRTPKSLSESISRYVQMITDPAIQKTIASVYTNKWKEFFEAPAAKKHHHAYKAGLAYHTVRMLELAEFICSQRPFLNKDFIIAAILMHDFWKLHELKHKYGIVSDLSDKGKLLGHIYGGASLFESTARSLGFDPEEEKFAIVIHMILSHHGKLEWGSPVTPKVPEAYALHYIDIMDAKLQVAEDETEFIGVGEWVEWVSGLDGSSVMRHSFDGRNNKSVTE